MKKMLLISTIAAAFVAVPFATAQQTIDTTTGGSTLSSEGEASNKVDSGAEGTGGVKTTASGSANVTGGINGTTTLGSDKDGNPSLNTTGGGSIDAAATGDGSASVGKDGAAQTLMENTASGSTTLDTTGTASSTPAPAIQPGMGGTPGTGALGGNTSSSSSESNASVNNVNNITIVLPNGQTTTVPEQEFNQGKYPGAKKVSNFGPKFKRDKRDHPGRGRGLEDNPGHKNSPGFNKNWNSRDDD